MVFKHFRFVSVLRIIILSCTVFILIYIMQYTNLYASVVVFVLLIIYQIYSLIRYVETTNRDLKRFLEAIGYSDFSQTFANKHMGKSFEELNKEFTQVIKKFQKAREEKEAHFRYLQTVVQHVGIGLISFLPNGQVGLINSAAKKLLGIPYLRNIRDLESIDKGFVDKLLKLQAGEKSLLKVEVDGETLQLAVYATYFQLQDMKYTLVSMQNIGQELEETELESWQKLIRVLTHEIMNSVTPISSLASTINKMLSEEGIDFYRKHGEIEAVEDIRDAVETIEKRSNGLLHFVDTYRNLTRLPKPNFQIFSVSHLFKQIQQLMQPKVMEKKIDFQMNLDPDSLKLTADLEMIEQVLINLLINAIQAVEKAPHAEIELKSWMNQQGRVVIEISDNGTGIPEDVQEKIFIPFFTTKKEGSGIGLSLARQIMRLHRGSITVNSKPNERTAFTLRF